MYDKYLYINSIPKEFKFNSLVQDSADHCFQKNCMLPVIMNFIPILKYVSMVINNIVDRRLNVYTI